MPDPPKGFDHEDTGRVIRIMGWAAAGLALGIIAHFAFKVLGAQQPDQAQFYQVLRVAADAVAILAVVVLILEPVRTLIRKASLPGATSTITTEVWILNRFAYTEIGEMIFDQWEDLAPGGKLYVQVQLPNGAQREYSVPWEVFLECGEGQKGIGVIEGSYLIGFSPNRIQQIGQGPPPDPFHPGAP